VTNVRSVFTYLGPDQVAQGFYTLDGDRLTMMGDDGQGNWSPLILDDEPVTATVPPEHAEAVAKRLTRRIRKAFRGETVDGFGRALSYETETFA
jgi:hypothetical protein